MPSLDHVTTSIPPALLLSGSSAAMQELWQLLDVLADSDGNLLLCGEPGTGKRALAELLYQRSARRAAPLLVYGGGRPGKPANGARDAEGTIEDLRRRSDATVYVPTVEHLSPRDQQRLVELLAARSPAGAPRVIAASARSLDGLVRAGRFRADLFFALGVVRLNIPPLRERREDIAPLARALAWRICPDLGRPPIVIGHEAAAALTDHAWPGNVRELSEVLAAAIAASSNGRLGAERVRALVGRRPRPGLDVCPLREIERDHIAAALRHCGWNQSLAARQLGIGRNTLLRKIRAFGLVRSDAAA